MIVSVELGFASKRGEGSMKAAVEVPDAEVTVTEMVPVLQRLTSMIVDGVLQDSGEKVSCRAGCGACCRQLVPIGLFEAEALAAWIRSLPTEQQEMLEARFASAVNELQEKGMLHRLDTDILDTKNVAQFTVGMDYLRAKVACPFLVNESCSIHPIRPLICREYMVTSPPEFCAAPWDNQVEGVVVPIKLSTALFRLGKKVDVGGQGWLPLVMLFEWMKSGGKPGEAVRGSGQEVLGSVLGELQS